MAVDLQSTQVELIIAPVSGTATAAGNCDCGDANYATVIVSLASEVNTSATGPDVSLLHSDDTVVTNFATITADRADEDITAAKNVVYHVDMRGRKRYLRVKLTPATTTNDTAVAAVNVIKSRQTLGPASTSDMVTDTYDRVVIP